MDKMPGAALKALKAAKQNRVAKKGGKKGLAEKMPKSHGDMPLEEHKELMGSMARKMKK